jgi:hypothetical protein
MGGKNIMQNITPERKRLYLIIAAIIFLYIIIIVVVALLYKNPNVTESTDVYDEVSGARYEVDNLPPQEALDGDSSIEYFGFEEYYENTSDVLGSELKQVIAKYSKEKGADKLKRVSIFKDSYIESWNNDTGDYSIHIDIMLNNDGKKTPIDIKFSDIIADYVFTNPDGTTTRIVSESQHD